MLSLRKLAVVAALVLPTVTALSTISVKGAKFFVDGQQFFIKGVAYQGTPADPLVDTTQCTYDAALMATIGTNSIRVYHVDPTQDHDGCMAAFSDKGIYVWLDLDTFTTAIYQSDPTWEQYQFGNFTAVMDTFINYDNLAGFWVGNEVIDSAAGSVAAPYVKAAVADMKSYMTVKNYRTTPIGYSAADIAQLRPALQNYLVCGTDFSQSIDFFGLNSYEWCGSDATYETSGYANLQALAEGYPVPMFFSETGCIVPRPRTFGDQAAIFGPNMDGTWSGAIIYEWVQETNDYGLVDYPNGQIYDGAPTAIQPDFSNLATAWAAVSPSSIAAAAYTPSLTAPACPGATDGWAINGNVALPTLGSAIVQAEAASVKPTPSASSASSSSTTSSSTSKTSSTATGLSPSPSPSTSSSLSTASSSSSAISSASLTSSTSRSPFASQTSTTQMDSLSSMSSTTVGSQVTLSGKSKYWDPAPYTTLSSFSSTTYPTNHKYKEKMATYTMLSGSIPVETMTLIIPKKPQKMIYDSIVVVKPTNTVKHDWKEIALYSYTTTFTSALVGPSWVRLDSPRETDTTTGSSTKPTGTSDGDSKGTTTSASPASSSSTGVGSNLGVPAGIAGGILGLLITIFL